mmetsp:Transcript_6359/g.18694  ORF Transcript_6359/g.18694 Transcript_6359/m.18694 type:complete len:99 (+) Transcript_6359:838-1134(+)
MRPPRGRRYRQRCVRIIRTYLRLSRRKPRISRGSSSHQHGSNQAKKLRKRKKARGMFQTKTRKARKVPNGKRNDLDNNMGIIFLVKKGTPIDSDTYDK